jgi:Anion-transporting ATPase/CBS domain
MEGLLAHSLIVVTGNGGVGKSTVAAALGLAADRRGLRTIVVEVAARDDLSRALSTSDADAEQAISDHLHHISIDPQRAVAEYLRQQLPIGALAALLARSRIFTALGAATPGMRELLTVGKVWELAQHQRRTRGSRSYDLVTDVARLMATHHVHCVAVMGLSYDHPGEKRVSGIISDSDLVRAGIRTEADGPAGGLALQPIVSVEPTMPLREAGS